MANFKLPQSVLNEIAGEDYVKVRKENARLKAKVARLESDIRHAKQIRDSFYEAKEEFSRLSEIIQGRDWFPCPEPGGCGCHVW